MNEFDGHDMEYWAREFGKSAPQWGTSQAAEYADDGDAGCLPTLADSIYAIWHRFRDGDETAAAYAYGAISMADNITNSGLIDTVPRRLLRAVEACIGMPSPVREDARTLYDRLRELHLVD